MLPGQTPDAAEAHPEPFGQIPSDGAAVVQINEHLYVFGRQSVRHGSLGWPRCLGVPVVVWLVLPLAMHDLRRRSLACRLRMNQSRTRNLAQTP